MHAPPAVNGARLTVRATVDTNIWVSSMISRQGGAPARLRAAYLAGRFTLVTSEPLMDELAGVLSRPRFVLQYGVTPDEIDELVGYMRENAHIVVPAGAVRICHGADDDVVIETAILSIADFLMADGMRSSGSPGYCHTLGTRKRSPMRNYSRSSIALRLCSERCQVGHCLRPNRPCQIASLEDALVAGKAH
jgi:uncharacterized protein